MFVTQITFVMYSIVKKNTKKKQKTKGVIPIYIFGFTCHQNAFTIANELKNNTQSRLDRVVIFSILICAAVYCIVSYAGLRFFFCFFLFFRCLCVIKLHVSKKKHANLQRV